MDLLDLPHELLSYIVHFADLDTLCALCLTEKRILHNIARDFLWRNVTVVFGADQNPKPNLFSFNSGHLVAVRSFSIIVDGYFDIGLPSFSSVLAAMINISHVRVSGGSGPFIRLILENTMASLVTLELNRCYVEPQDFSKIIPIVIRDLRISCCHSNLRFLLGPLTVDDLEVHGPDLDGDGTVSYEQPENYGKAARTMHVTVGMWAAPNAPSECVPIGVTLRRLTDAHLGKFKRLCLIDTCRDAGCRDLLHLARALERPFSSLEELILDIPLSQDMHQKLIQLIPAFPVLQNSRIVSTVNETSLGHFQLCVFIFSPDIRVNDPPCPYRYPKAMSVPMTFQRAPSFGGLDDECMLSV
ncbi:hypothetical protein ARMSODRAFT_978635 [Armillaria solidipes]|uniref:F-box domain-containing protein n=1 Tax=Armillaria solidipes TaxID=1076256 RepID=A0A2H3B236_9AGAR|nr:hypothetical protein ARMSODRAFT_978635 [Armillaria solidipes]